MAKIDKPEIIYYPYIGEKLNDEPFNLSNGVFSWTHQLKRDADKLGYEIHTPDKAKWKNVAGVLFFDNLFYHNLSALQDLHNRNLLHKTIYIDYEPPTGHAKKHEPESIRKLSKLFKNVITYDDDLAGTGNFIKGNVANFYSNSSIKTNRQKEKLAIMITNNTTTKTIANTLNYWNNTDYYNTKNIKYHKNSAYHKRLEVVNYFLRHHPDDLDLYGDNYPKETININKGFLDRSNKLEVMQKYKFAITFDSYINQKGYISEKIFDAFYAGVIPVYIGADNVRTYIPDACFIDANEFNTFDEIYEYMSKMSTKEYKERLLAIRKFLQSKKFKKVFSSEATASILLNTIHQATNKNYSYSAAHSILQELLSDKTAIQPSRTGVTSIGKEQIDGSWFFVARIGQRNDDTRIMKIEDKIFCIQDGKHKKVKTRYLDLSGEKSVAFNIAYKDIIKSRKIEYFIKYDNKFIKLPFLDGSTISNTDIGYGKLIVRNNTILLKNNYNIGMVSMGNKLFRKLLSDKL